MLNLFAVILFTCKQCIIKQLLDSVFAISGIIKVSVSVTGLKINFSAWSPLRPVSLNS